MNLLKQQRAIGTITLLSGLLALASLITGMVAVNYHTETFSDPTLILTTPGTNATAGRWSMIFDMFGYYLLLLPVIYLLHDWMKDKTAWSNLVTFTGLAYVLVGAIGAAILAAVWPAVMNAYPTAGTEMQLLLKSNFGFFNDMVYNGMWNLLEMFFAGTWWFVTGLMLYRSKYTVTAVLTIATGIASFADGTAGMLQLTSLHETALNTYLLLAIIWTIIMGIFFLQGRLK